MTKDARDVEFSEDRRYRYMLLIRWDTELPLVQYIGLNPSTADETNDDPTIRRCKRFAADNGFGGMVMTNLFAFRVTDPKQMMRVANPIGEGGTFISQGNQEFHNRNDFYLYATALRCPTRIACWGTHGNHLSRAVHVKWLMRDHGLALSCFALTKEGHPKHPLYLKADLKPMPMSL